MGYGLQSGKYHYHKQLFYMQMLVQLKLAGPSPPPPPRGRRGRVGAEEGMAQLISAAPTFAYKTVAFGNYIFRILAFYEL